MDLNTFFEHFDTLAEAPNGLQRLRELILDMAVRGKLVPQDSEDISGEETHQKLLQEKAKLIKARKIRSGKKSSPIEASEISMEIPKNWKWIRLNDIGDWGAGATPLRSNPDYYGGAYDWFKSGELPDGFLEGPSKETITDLALEECSLRRNQPGDVLIAMYGATIGKLAILKSPATTNQAVCACTCLPSIYNRYLFTFLLAWRKNFSTMGAGAAQPNISRVKIIQTPFPLPPLAEQKRIVAKVDELMALCDTLESAQQTRNTLRQSLRASALDALMNATSDTELETAWAFVRDNWGELSRVPEDVEGVRQAVAQVALFGKITFQNETEGSASELIEQLLRQKKELVAKKQIPKPKKLESIQGKTIPYTVPKTWSWVQLGTLAKNVEYGTSQKASLQDNGVPVFRMNNIQSGELLYENLKYVSASIKDLPRLYLCEGDLLFNRTNSYELVGKTAVFRSDDERYTFASYLIRISLFLEFSVPEFVNLALNSTYFRQTQIEPEIVQQCGQANFNGTKLQNTLIPLPPLAEQKRIVAKVDELMKLCDQLEASLRQQQGRAEALAASAVSDLAA